MPQQITTYMFVPATKRRFIERAVKWTSGGPDRFIFDFEDAIRDVFDLENEGSMKLSARETLASYFPFPKELQKRYMLRINAVTTPPFEADIEFLKKTKDNPPVAIMLPKAESKTDITTLELAFPDLTSIIPLIETQKGVDNIDEILTSSSRIKSFCFGHIDYFFEKKIFPIPMTMRESKKLMFLIETLIEKSIIHKKEYIDMGFYYLGRPGELSAQCHQLYRLNRGRGKIGKLVMHPDQIDVIKKAFTEREKKGTIPSIKEMEMSAHEKKALASEIVRSYTERPDKTVGIGILEDRIIPPQLYILAKEFLKTN